MSVDMACGAESVDRMSRDGWDWFILIGCVSVFFVQLVGVRRPGGVTLPVVAAARLLYASSQGLQPPCSQHLQSPPWSSGDLWVASLPSYHLFLMD